MCQQTNKHFCLVESGKIPTAPLLLLSCFNKQTFHLERSQFSLITVCLSMLQERHTQREEVQQERVRRMFVGVLPSHDFHYAIKA